MTTELITKFLFIAIIAGFLIVMLFNFKREDFTVAKMQKSILTTGIIALIVLGIIYVFHP